MPTRILGISAYYHDSAACLLVDGEIIAAAQEERFTRKKHDAGFPCRAVEYCLREGGITIDDIDLVGFYEKPLVKFDRLLETYIACTPQGLRSYLMALPLWLTEKLWMSDAIASALNYKGALRFGDHHESHAASAFYPSPFEAAAIVTMDGVGEWATSSVGVGHGHEMTILREQKFPHSLGLLYSAFTYFAGFRVNSGEYKLMGLAPYGEPTYVSLIKDHLLEIRPDGSLWMNMDYFEYPHGLTMTGERFERLFRGPARQAEAALTQREMDLARSIQEITEEVVLKTACFAHRETALRNLCLAGGVALNCVANGRLVREGPFDEIWIQPAAGDAGGAVGIAFSLWHRYLKQPRTSAESTGAWRPQASTLAGETAPYADAMKGSFLGPSFSNDEIRTWLDGRGYHARCFTRSDLTDAVAAYLAEGKVIGLMQGRMEFGPRALGGRSIIGDARSPTMQSVMNLKIKFRESFRPFAPAILRDRLGDYFELDRDSPYMLLVAGIAASHRLEMPATARALWGIDKLNVPRSDIPAVTHVDYSARIQTVRQETNPLFHDIIKSFFRRTGCPVIVNTSFNVRGEPIVCSLDDAYRCFMRTDLDVLVLEQYVLLKTDQAAIAESDEWRREFVLD